jgi:D-psicose/D-tagatose/L-ribulose 3-epimerase
MKIGFNMLLWTGFVAQEHHALLEALKAAGYDGVEVPLFAGDLKHYRRLGQILREIGLECTAATAMPSAEHSLLSPRKADRQRGLRHIRWATDCTAAMGATLLAGPMHQALGVFSGQGPTHDEKQRASDVHRIAADHAADAGVTLAVEYLNRFECYFLNTLADTADYVKLVNHRHFAAMYDTFHANIEERDPVGVIGKHIDVIRHVHVSENDRGTPGCGHVPIRSTLRALKEAGYDGWLTIEAFGRALPDLAAATRVWRDLFASPEHVYREGIKVIRRSWK